MPPVMLSRDSRLGARDNHRSRFRVDLPLVGMLMFLCVFGLLVLYSASGQNMQIVLRQCAFLLVGWTGMFLVCSMDSRSISRLTLLIYMLGLIALVAVEFFGITAKGAQRWLSVPGLFRVQPSELMKWVIPLSVASYLSRCPLPPHLKHVVVVLLIIFLPMSLIMLQPDLGTALLLASSGLAVLFLAGWHWRHMFVFGISVLAILPLAWKFILHDYQRNRVVTMLFSNNDPFGAGWSIGQSKVAIGSGGWTGKGWLNGSQSQLQFLPESDTDFIMAVLAEEGGFIGVLFLLILYTIILTRCAQLSFRAPDNFGRLFSSAVTLVLSLFIFVNIAMVSGLLPVVGVPLPLISRGGSSLVSSLIAFGLLMSVCSQQGRIIR